MPTDSKVFDFILEELKQINQNLKTNGEILSSNCTKLENHEARISKIENNANIFSLLIFIKSNWKTLTIIFAFIAYLCDFTPIPKRATDFFAQNSTTVKEIAVKTPENSSGK